jgi:phosphate starvation-inducible PhoH-like protein
LAVRSVLEDIDGLVFVELGSGDVVRHRIVQDIVDAYERHESAKAASAASAASERKS